MKKYYIEAEIDIINLQAADVITSSGGDEIPDEEGGSWGPYV